MKKNGRDLWLQENAVSAVALLETFSKVEETRNLMPRELQIKELALAYGYLLSSFYNGQLHEYEHEVVLH